MARLRWGAGSTPGEVTSELADLTAAFLAVCYQAARVVVEAMHAYRLAPGERALTRASTDPESILRGLAADPAPANRLYRTMEAYFFNGYPRASAPDTGPPDEQTPTLSLLVSMAERWMIGHEYGHGVSRSTAGAPDEVNPAKAEEYFADSIAMNMTVLSAAQLDSVAPEHPLGGAIFSLAYLDLLRRALYLLLTGDEHWPHGESDTHPPPRDRATQLINGFREFFDVEYPAEGGFELRLKSAPEASRTHGFTRERSSIAYTYARILEDVWNETKGRLLLDWQRGRPLHPMWR